ncbi:MAG TPA: hypothetical protein VHW95_09550 [Steroidobacteraceae bacterium]|nr:hypothetical protein [Steroidobacteraceae bacterium]
MKLAIIVLGAAVSAVGGCAAQISVLPKDYGGPTAVIADSTYNYSSRKSDFFYVDAIDGRPVLNGLDRTVSANRGNGFGQHAVDADRLVEPRPTVFHIVGSTHYAAPILAMAGTSYHVDGDVKFTPVAGAAYVVTGSLGPDYSAVWIQNKDTHVQMGNKLLIKGAAEAGPLEKKRAPEQVPPTG